MLPPVSEPKSNGAPPAATIAAELGETAVGSEHYRALFTLGVMLFAVTFTINLLADIAVRGRRDQRI